MELGLNDVMHTTAGFGLNTTNPIAVTLISIFSLSIVAVALNIPKSNRFVSLLSWVCVGGIPFLYFYQSFAQKAERQYTEKFYAGRAIDHHMLDMNGMHFNIISTFTANNRLHIFDGKTGRVFDISHLTLDQGLSPTNLVNAEGFTEYYVYKKGCVLYLDRTP